MATSASTPRSDSDQGGAVPHATVVPVDADKPLWAEPAEEVLDALPGEDDPRRYPKVLPVKRTAWRALGEAFEAVVWLVEWPFGVATLIVGLALLAAIPFVGFLSLGYLLEAGGRLARTDPERQQRVQARRRNWFVRLILSTVLTVRDSFIGVRKAARVRRDRPGRLADDPAPAVPVVAVRLGADHRSGRPAARVWKAVLLVATVLMALRIALALARGGRLRYFFWFTGNVFWLVRRLIRGGYYAEARDAVWNFVAGLRLPYYWWLGFRGFVVGLAWLAIPVGLLALGHRLPPLGFVGGVWFAMVLLGLPFLQMRLAAENRFRAGFELGPVLSPSAGRRGLLASPCSPPCSFRCRSTCSRSSACRARRNGCHASSSSCSSTRRACWPAGLTPGVAAARPRGTGSFPRPASWACCRRQGYTSCSWC